MPCDIEYVPGTFCKKINCSYHKILEQSSNGDYVRNKKILCDDCYAWQFCNWLKENDWKVMKSLKEIPRMSGKELALHIKGIVDTDIAEDLSLDDVLCL